MAAITSKVGICNLALANLGNYGTVTNIDTPSNDKEIVFSTWYDICRQAFLKQTMPNFALARRIVARVDETPLQGFRHVFEKPNDCLKVIGIGDIEDLQPGYTVEGNRVYVGEDYPDGLPIRFILDFQDVSHMTPEFVMGLAVYLSSKVARSITQSEDRVAAVKAEVVTEMAAIGALNAQENKPIRVSRSRFRQARVSGFARAHPEKR